MPYPSPRDGRKENVGVEPSYGKMLTIADVALRLQVSESKIRRAIDRGELAVYRLPALRISEDDLAAYLEGKRSRPPVAKRPPPARLKHLKLS
jgi:excisionase family DNA binding protein